MSTNSRIQIPLMDKQHMIHRMKYNIQKLNEANFVGKISKRSTKQRCMNIGF